MTADNPRGRQAVEISAAFTGIAGIVVLLRLYTRFFLVRCPGIEDYGTAFSMLCSVGLTICIACQADYGMGKHIATLQPDEMQKSLKAFWASLIFYYFSLGATKMSILLQYIRVFTLRKFQIVCWVVIGIVGAFSLWTLIGSIFACVPISAFWTREPARCINQFAMWFTNAGFNIVSDFVCIILPIPLIRSLNLGRRQKVALISIFAVGGFVCIVSILRLQSLVAISNSSDPTYDNPPAATWSSVEINVAIICSCLPLLRPLMTRVLPGAMSSRKRSAHATPRTYATLGTTRSRKDAEAAVGDELELTRHSYPMDGETGGEIRCVTDIHIHIEGNRSQTSIWKPQVPDKDWSEKTVQSTSSPTHDRASSTETLVKEPKRL